MKFDFDKVVCRKNSNCVKWDKLGEFFKNEEALPLWVADMDFEVEPSIIEDIEKRLKHNVFGYTYLNDSYYEAVISWMKTRHNWDVQKEWIKFTPGVVPGLSYIIGALTEPGDEIIVQSPVYHQFFSVINNNKCKVVDNPLNFDGERYTMDLQDLENKITDKTKMILLCSPHNPVGRVWNEEELKALGEICLKHNILVVSDEIHSDIVFKGYKHRVFSMIDNRFEDISIICTAPNKTFNIAGFHTANIMIPNKEVRDKISEYLQRLCIMGPTVFGAVAQEAAYSKGEEWYQGLMEYVEDNKDFAIDFIDNRLKGVKVVKPEATYLLWADFSCLNMSAEELNEFFIQKCGVILNQGRVFGDKADKYQRINLGTQRSVIKEALERIEKGMMSLEK